MSTYEILIMIYKKKVEEVLRKLWKPDYEEDSEAYNSALQDVQTAIEDMEDEFPSRGSGFIGRCWDDGNF